MDDRDPLADVDAVPEETTLLVTLERVGGVDDAPGLPGDEGEALLIRDGEAVHGWWNHCQHWTHVRLDDGDGASVRAGAIRCRRHGATFERDTGECVAGPCVGATLESVGVVVDDGRVYLDEPGWAFAHRGPASTADGDRSTPGGDGY